MNGVIGHVFDLDWSQMISSIISVIIILLIPIGWGAKMLLSLDKRTTILETRSKTDVKKLDTIDRKISDVVDSIHIIQVAIAKIETVIASKLDDSNISTRS